MGKSLLAFIALGLMASPAFGITFMSLANSGIFYGGELEDTSTDLAPTIPPYNFGLLGFRDQDDVPLPEM